MTTNSTQHMARAVAVVVNDDLTQIAGLSGLLAKEGLEVQSFSDATSALEAMSRVAPPDLIVTDLYMPGMNLSVNARDAMPTGGVLFLKLRNQVLGEADVTRHPRAKPGPYVVFQVIDSGQGMPPGVVERIFAPFFTTKPQGQGTGLGLSTVIGIVEEHGGFVLVNTQMGRGTTFSAFLPAEPDSHETPDEGSRPESSPRHEEGILVVDDETSILNVAHQFLTQQGYKVRTAKSASEGLELFQAHRSDVQLVITDLMMPFGDGRQLIQSLREFDPHLPILVMSGLLTPSLEAEILAQEDCRFLVKPFTAEELFAKLRELLPGKPV